MQDHLTRITVRKSVKIELIIVFYGKLNIFKENNAAEL